MKLKLSFDFQKRRRKKKGEKKSQNLRIEGIQLIVFSMSD